MKRSDSFSRELVYLALASFSVHLQHLIIVATHFYSFGLIEVFFKVRLPQSLSLNCCEVEISTNLKNAV